uniref:Sulfotransferase n=1 Tax=Dunaliella tertiolecta TaxID=3047 RepID=A0A7S3VLJ3_DUNTE|mmetsp:Transcript_452/g.1110  ORF Transcript_452/g.1110 Transcript_452/m.1110 type:complete len:245 (-) Transcript_452:331-1065(-)
MQGLCSALAASGAEEHSSSVNELLQALQDAGELLQVDCQISSPGGCGSSHLSSFLNQHGFSTNLQTDSDNLRHCNKPPSWPRDRCPRCVIYLYCDPLEVVASHYRRGHAWHQSLKTCGKPRVHEQRAQSAFPPSLEAYCELGIDLFGLEDHFHNWKAGANYEILIVRYEHVFDPPVAQALFSRLCAPRNLTATQVEDLAAKWTSSKKERQSKVPDICRTSSMYINLQKEMNQMPPFVVLPKSGS